MSAIKSQIVVGSEQCKKNREHHLAVINELNQNLLQGLLQAPPVNSDGSGKHKKADVVSRHQFQRHQLLARDRVELVLDEGSPFLELLALAGHGQDGIPTGASVIAGIGLVNGVECMISANVATMAGGAINEAAVMKTARLHQICVENRLPSINLTQSAGANLSQQFRVFHAGGASFRHMAERSKMGLPTATVCFGSSTAGGAYTVGMADYTVLVKDKAKVFLAGPPLVKMATNEVVDDESLGGADMHSRKSGVSDHLAMDEYDAIKKVREFIKYFNWQKLTPLPQQHLFHQYSEPVYSPDEIPSILPASIKTPFNAMEVIARIVDGSRFSDFKPLYGPNLITGWAHIHGFPVGIISNNNPIFPEDANKAVQFIQLCNMKNVPIIYLQNITGFMVGRKYEEAGIIKAGSRFINAVSNSKVPTITIMMAASFGAGNYAMNGRAYNPRFLFSWPQSKCSVMGSDQLVGVMDQIMKDGLQKRGKKLSPEMEQQAEMRKEMFRQLVESESDVYYTSSRCLDDGVIDPRDTRTVIALCLSVCYGNKVLGGNIYGISRM
ncbi:hypothetical protein MP228_005134 [Amoeboaphelidium protococcarum]|nr:hypothetical protein MP228_005134 [Amoeboaphelidium protococcarum]